MVLKDSQQEILHKLIRQEQLLSELYGIFAEQFPQYSDFWKGLSDEEKRHTMLIQKLADAVGKGQVLFEEGRITITSLNTLILRLEAVLQKAQNGGYSLAAALICAIDYETSLIEKNIFSHFDSQNKKVNAALKTLQAETQDHVASIRKVQQELKNDSPK